MNFDTSDQTSYLFKDSLNIPFTNPDKPWFQEPAGRSMVNSIDFNDLWTETQGLKDVPRNPTSVETNGDNKKATSTSSNPQPSRDATKFLLNDINSIALYKDVVLTPPTSPDENNGGVFTCLAADGTTNLLQDIIGNKFNKEVILYKGTDRVYQLGLSNSDAADNNINKWFLDTKSGGLYISNYDSTDEYKLTFYRYEGGKGYEGFVNVNIVEGNIGGTVDGTLKISKKLQAPQIDGSGSLYTTMDSFDNSQWENSTDPYNSNYSSKEITHIKASADSNKLAFSIEDNENLKVINISSMATKDSAQILVDDFDNLIKNNINNSFEINSLDINGNGDEIIIKNKFQSDIQTKINQPVTEQEVRFPLYSENYNWKLDFEAYKKEPPEIQGAMNAASWKMIRDPIGKLTYINQKAHVSSYFRQTTIGTDDDGSYDFQDIQAVIDHFRAQGIIPGQDYQVIEYRWNYTENSGIFAFLYKISKETAYTENNPDTNISGSGSLASQTGWTRNKEGWNLYPYINGRGLVYNLTDSVAAFVYDNIEDTFNTGVNSKQDDDIYIRLSISNNHLSDEEIQEIAPGSTKISRTIFDSEPYILGIHSSGYLWDLQKNNANFKQDVKNLYSGSPQKKAEALKYIRENIKIEYSSDSYFFLKKGDRYLSDGESHWAFTREKILRNSNSTKSVDKVTNDYWRIRAAKTKINENEDVFPKLINTIKVTNDGYLIGYHNDYKTNSIDILNIGNYEKNIVWSSYGTSGSLKEIAYDVDIATLGRIILGLGGRIPIYSGEMNGVTNPSNSMNGWYNETGGANVSVPKTYNGMELPPAGPFQDTIANPPLIYSPLKADYDLITKGLESNNTTNGFETFISFGNYLTCFDIINQNNSWDNQQGNEGVNQDYNNLNIGMKNHVNKAVGWANVGIITYNLHQGGKNSDKKTISRSDPILFENKSLKLEFKEYSSSEYRLCVIYKDETEPSLEDMNYIFVDTENPFDKDWSLILEVGGAGKGGMVTTASSKTWNISNKWPQEDFSLFNYERYSVDQTNAIGYNLYIKKTSSNSNDDRLALFQNRQFIVPFIWSSQIGIPGHFPVYTAGTNLRPMIGKPYRAVFLNSIGQPANNDQRSYSWYNSVWTSDIAKANPYNQGMQGTTHIFIYLPDKNDNGSTPVNVFTSLGRKYTRTIQDGVLLYDTTVSGNYRVDNTIKGVISSWYSRGVINQYAGVGVIVTPIPAKYGRKEDGITNYVDYFGAPSYDILNRKWVSSYLVKKSVGESKYTMSKLLLNENVEINKNLSDTDCIIQISKETISPPIIIENEAYTRIVCLLDITGRSLFMRTRHEDDASKDHFTSLNLYEADRAKNIIENGNVDQILMTSNSKYLLLKTSDSKIKFLNISSGKLDINNYDDTNQISMANTTAKPFGISPIYNDSLYISVLSLSGADNVIVIKKIKFSNNQIESITDDSSITYTKSISNLDFTSRISRDFDYNNIQLYVTESDGTAIKIYQRKDAGEEGISYNLLIEKTGLGDALANDKFPKVTVGYKTYYLYKGNATPDKLNDGKILRIYKNNLILNENYGNVGIGTTSLDNDYKLSIYGGDLLINNGLGYGTIAGGNGDNKIYLGKTEDDVENTVEIKCSENFKVTSDQSSLMSINDTTGLSVTSPGVNKSTSDGIGPPGAHMGIDANGNTGLLLVAEQRGALSYIDFNTENSGYRDFMGRILVGKDNGMTFYTNNIDRMNITPTGRVGIGKWPQKSPPTKLEVGGDVTVGWISGSKDGIWISHSHPTGDYSTTPFIQGVTTGFGGGNLALNPAYGYVGIRTNNPTYPLHIGASVYKAPKNDVSNDDNEGTGTATPVDGYYRFAQNTSYSGNSSNEAYHLSVWAAGYYVGTGLFNSSDIRIKEKILDVNDNKALKQIRDISCVYYEYKDKINRGSKPTIGFIAQQVNEHMPMAVSLQKDIIPNEMRIIENPQWKTLTDNSENATFKLTIPDLEDVSGNTKYCFYMSNDISGNDEVKKEAKTLEDDPKSFIFDQKWSNVFLYGKEVDDFHILDKQKLFTLNFSATQEIDRIQQKQILDISLNKIDIETTQLDLVEARTKISTLENEVTVLKNQNSNLLTRIEALEKSINSST